jgi:hypothetical protein
MNEGLLADDHARGLVVGEPGVELEAVPPTDTSNDGRRDRHSGGDSARRIRRDRGAGFERPVLSVR